MSFSSWLSYTKSLMVASFDIKYDQKAMSRCSRESQRPRIGHSNPHSSYIPLSILDIAARFFLYKSNLTACLVLRDQLLVHQVPGEERRRSTLLYKHGIFRYNFFSYRVMDLIRPCHLDFYCETVSIPTSISTLVFPIAKYLKSSLGYLEQYY